MHEGVAPQSWSLVKRVGFRFVFAYAVVFFEPFPLDAVPVVGDWIDEKNAVPWKALVAWLAHHVLHVDAPYVENGSGDTTWSWVGLLAGLLVAAVATLVWSLLDRKRAAYPKLAEWMQVGLRYSLAWVLLGYGLDKVFKSQFPLPGPERLVERLGDFSPMGLLWTFMGYSTPYTIFAGAMECLGALLLLFRRTTTFGALVLVGVMSNVVLLNFCYDVPVKIYSSQLLVTALVILAPDARRLFDVLVMQRAAAARDFPAYFTTARARWAGLGVKVLVIGLALYARVSAARDAYAQWGDGAPRAPLRGVWVVEAFARDGQDVDRADPERWTRVAVNDNGRLSIARAGDTSERLWFKDDADRHVLSMHLKNEEKIELAYARPDQAQLTLAGDYRGAKVAVKLRRLEEGKFPLLDRGFHWVNEMPFNQ